MKAVKNLKYKSGQMLRKILHGKDGEARHHNFAIPSEIRNLFQEYAEGQATLSETGLQNFLLQCQKERAEDIVVGDVSHFDEDFFLEYLLDPKNDAINKQVHQDMTRPLSNYFIWTGHNSYLTGNQLSSDCGVEPIISALKKGVRVIELDTWPDSDGKKILVLHGRTMTKPVKFKDCINAIKEHAFEASEYPLIITLEDHLKPELQKKAAKRITKAFGDKLFKVNIDEPLKAFPSPEECKGLVLISTKPPVKKESYADRASEDPSKKSHRSTRSQSSTSGGRTDLGEELQVESRTTKACGEKLYNLNIDDPHKASPSSEERKEFALISGEPPVKKEGHSKTVHEEHNKTSRQTTRSRTPSYGGRAEWGEELQPAGSGRGMRRLRSRVQSCCGDPREGDCVTSADRHAMKLLRKERLNLPSDSDDDLDEDEDGEPMDHHYLRMISIKGGKISSKDYENALRHFKEEVKRVSLSEHGLVKVAKLYPDDLVKFTQNNLLRIFPAASRIDSSNYNPILAWLFGAQLVAFNMQGVGRPLWLMDGFFRANGGCGYVLKPDVLLKGPVATAAGKLDEESTKGRPKPRSRPVTPTRSFSPFDDTSVPAQPVKLNLKVRVLMGDGWLDKFPKDHFDRFSAPDFYVRVGIAGVAVDSVMYKTDVVSNRWHPVWKDNEFEFNLTVPEIAVLRFECHDYDDNGRDDFAGQTAYPVSELRQGYRAVPLNDKKGDSLLPVRLLCYFSITKL